MLCDRCHGREAVVHVTQIINGHRTELHLCEECARKERVVHRSFESFGSHMFRSPLESFFEGPMRSFFGRSPIEIEALPEERETPMFTEGLRRSPESYEAFREKIRPAFSHGGIHEEKAPAPKKEVTIDTENTAKSAVDPELAKLQKAMKSAIAREDYEQAAHIRDEMKKLEK